MGPAPIRFRIDRQVKAVENKYGCKIDMSGYCDDVNDSNIKAIFSNGYTCENSTIHGLDFALGLAKVCKKF